MQALQTYSLDLADTDTLYAFYLAQTATQSQFTQMSAGHAILAAQSVDLDDIRLVQVKGDGHHLWTDSVVRDEWRFAVLLSGEGHPRLGATEITENTGHLLRPEESSDLKTNGEYTTVEVIFAAHLADKVAWGCAPGQVRNLSTGVVKTLTNCVENALKSASYAAVTHGLPFRKSMWRERIINALDAALVPWRPSDFADATDMSEPARLDIVRKVRPLLEDTDFVARTTVDDLAIEAGVSKRSLFHAFRTEYGMGPDKFRYILRLNGLRSTLYRSKHDEVSVTQVACDYGFAELGRMAGRYRDLFGELPSETLKRRPPARLS